MAYNAAQEQAINSRDGQIMVISCPGSGKTTTMLKRIHAMIEDGIRDDSMLVMTFTDAAANEMRDRYFSDYGACGVIFCTIHSLCNMILKESLESVSYRVLTGLEQYEVLARALKGVKLPAYVTKKDLLNDISGYKNNMEKFIPRTVDMETFQKIFEAYEMEKVSSGYIDFDDMLYKCKELLEDRSDILKRYQERFRYIMCDEYQDTNNLQKEILYLLAGKDGNIFIVGDDDQSIYGFRGADPNIMMNFALDFPHCKRITMGTNYRSEPEIVEAANDLIIYNKQRFSKDFRAAKDGKGRITYETSRSRTDEINYICDQIKRFRNNGTPFSEMAVLTRTNAQLVAIASMFEADNIPYHTQERIPDLYEDFIFGDMIAYLKLMNGTGTPKDFIRILNRPSRGFREASFANMQAVNRRELAAASLDEDFKGNINKAYELLDDLEGRRHLPFDQQVAAITDYFQYDSYIRNYMARINTEPSVVINKLQFMIDDAISCSNLSEWMRKAQEHARKHYEEQEKEVEHAVTLSTMHRSKGLEWEIVFLPDCCSGIVPLLSSKTEEEMEEERRLFYVAVTRAKKYLYVLNYIEKSSSKGTVSAVKPSPFINEMNGENRRKAESMKASEKAFAEKTQEQKDGFLEGNPRTFTKGMYVTHNQYGRGIVTMKNVVCVAVRFTDGTKVFKFD